MRVRHPSARKSNESLKHSRRHLLEFLEPRLLFASTSLTLKGGDVFEFQDFAGNIERVRLFGNITAQLIGAQVDGSNVVHLVNLPGNLNGTPVNGGIGTPVGAQPIGPITITDPFNAAGNTTTPAIQALAADGSGNLYAVNFLSVPPPANSMAQAQTIVQVVKMDPATGSGMVVADIQTQVNAGVAGLNGMVTGIPTAAFNPANGQLYFVATAGASNVPKLFSVNVNAGSNAAIQGTVAAVPGSFNLPANTGTTTGNGTGSTGTVNSPITAIAFDGGGNLIAAGNPTTTGGANANAAPQIFSVSVGNTNQIGTPNPITVNGAAAPGPVEGLAYYPGLSNPIAIVGTGSGAEVLNVSPGGPAVNFGPLPNGNTGKNPGGLTYDPALVDPFTGQRGALLATDTATHQLFYVSPQNRIPNNSIFAFYVSQSDFTGQIVVSEVPPLTANPRPMQPFMGSIGSLRVINAQTGQPLVVTAPSNSGEVLVGAETRHIDPNNANDSMIPITQAPVTSGINYGVLPSSITTLHSGLILAQGNNLGKFLVGGAVTGQVAIHGSVDQFYAGWLLTGNAAGEAAGVVSDPRNFQVDGDIRTLIVNGSIGTDSDAGLKKPTYETGFDLHAAGQIGTVHSYGSIIGAINADHASSVVGISTPQTELESKGIAPADPWDAGILGGNPPGDPNSDAIFNNDTFATAQYLAPQNDAGTGLQQGIVLNGVLQDDPKIAEKVDYYAVPLLAGQTITAVVHQTIPPPLVLSLGVFDPDGREVYTDYNKVDMSQTQQMPIQFTADKPGLWRFAVGVTGNGQFTATGGPTLTLDVPYTLTIQGVGDTGIGNIVAAQNIFDNPAGTPGFGAQAGDIGAIEAGGAFISISGNTVSAANGNVRSLESATMGDQMADPEISVPNGSVGLVRTTTGDMFFNHPPPPFLPPPIGGDYQMVSSAGNWSADLLAKGSIGTVKAQTMTNLYNMVPVLKVNTSNDPNRPGTIDLIDDAGDFGTLNLGGPQITTGPSGNVRYIHVLGTVYRDATFGGGTPEATQYQFGETANITDDGGTVTSITPTPTTAQTVTTTPATKTTTGTTTGTTGSTGSTSGTTSGTTKTPTPGTTTTTVTNADGSTTTTTVTIVKNQDGSFTTTTDVSTSTQLTVTAYGIEGSGGSAIVKVQAANGVIIDGKTGTNGLPNQSVDIGAIVTTGSGTPTVPGTTPIPPTPLIPTPNPGAPLIPNSGSTSGTGTTTGTGTGNSSGTGTGTMPSSTGQGTSGGSSVNGGVANSGFSGGTITYPFPPFSTTTGSKKTTPLQTVTIPLAPQLATTGNLLDVSLNGPANINVLDITGSNFTNIVDSTPGEIVDVHAMSIGQLASGGSLGLTQSHTPAAVLPLAVESNVFPFNQQHTAIMVGGGVGSTLQTGTTGTTAGGTTGTTTTTTGGDIVSASAPVVGNFDVAGAIGTLSGTIEGPIVTGAQINSVNIGKGIYASGTGDLSRAGLYAGGAIGNVANSVPAEIRGNVVSHTGLLSLDLHNGSIINSRLTNTTDYTTTREFIGLISIVDVPSPITHPTLDLGALSVTGNGGIIGTEIAFHHTGAIGVHDGFGMFDTYIPTVGDGTIESLSVDGYGLREVSFDGGSSIGSIVANGNGGLSSTANYSSDVRLSEVDTFDPNFGFMPNKLTDIHSMLGTTASTPVIAGVTDTGVIMDSSFIGNRDLGNVRAYQIRATDPVVAPTTFNFANSVGSITITSGANGLAVLTGRLNTFHPGGDLMHTNLVIAGPIKTFILNGNFLSSSSIIARGPNGNIQTIKINGNMQGLIEADGGRLGNVTIQGGLSGSVKSKLAGNITLRGGLANGSLAITGSAKSITVYGSLGGSGDTLSVGGSLGALTVRGDLYSNVQVSGNLTTLSVAGSIISPASVEVDGVLSLLKVGANVQAGVTVRTHVLKRKLVKGSDQGSYVSI